MKQSSRRLVSVKNNFSKRKKKKLKPHYLRLLSRANFALQKKNVIGTTFFIIKKKFNSSFCGSFFCTSVLLKIDLQWTHGTFDCMRHGRGRLLTLLLSM